MNSEELEQSLRTEFESYLKNVLADMRQEVAEFQKKFEAEFAKHKTQLDELFQNFSERVDTERQLDAGFTESVVEHLRLSRDEGARITATAIAEAEEMEKAKAAAAPPQPGIGEIRDAINDISSKTTQSTILKSLVNQAAQFTPRGAFFIIKNEHLLGWRVFGKEGVADEQTVREINFPTQAATVLGEAVRSLAAVESTFGTYADDSVYLGKLGFGEPDRMYAIPLVVRGRAVAVLYADYGEEGGQVNLEALETLVRVASLTVEVLASSKAAPMHAEATASTATQPETAQSDSHSESIRQYESAPAEATARPIAAAHFESAAEPAAASEERESFESAVSEPEYEYQAEVTEVEQSVEATYEAQPVERPAESFEGAGYQTSVENGGFAFTPSVTGEKESNGHHYDYMAEATPVETEVEQVAAPDEYGTGVEEDRNFESAETSRSWSAVDQQSDYPASPSTEEYEVPAHEVIETSGDEQPASADAEYASNFADGDLKPAEYSYESTYETIVSDGTATPAEQFESAPAQFEETPAPHEVATAHEAPAAYQAPQYEAAESYAPSNGQSYASYATEQNVAPAESFAPAKTETVSEPTPATRSRFSDRNVDLPIDVTEDERRLHNDARRFARLLVSEIKLYNEQKVREGREASDLYERLREAIDRSREMYDKRVQPPVAAKFDYFHYELVNNLAEGDQSKLGGSYPSGQI